MATSNLVGRVVTVRAMKTLGDRIRERREKLDLSQQELVERMKKAGSQISQQALSQAETGETKRTKYLAEIAIGLRTTDRWLLTGKGVEDVPPGSSVVPVPLSQIFTIGAVQAGVFREALEWPDEDWKLAPVSALNDWRHLPQFGLEVRGPSMNRVYPHGSTIICVKWFDAGLDIQQAAMAKKRVVVLRREPSGGGFEATVKSLEINEHGEFWLWPKSTDPNFQTPWKVSALAGKTTDNDDVRIVALVIGSFIPEPA